MVDLIIVERNYIYFTRNVLDILTLSFLRKTQHVD